jgi:hypothetical protein
MQRKFNPSTDEDGRQMWTVSSCRCARSKQTRDRAFKIVCWRSRLFGSELRVLCEIGSSLQS